MKKLATLLLALMLAATLLVASAEAVDYVGVWTATSIVTEGVSVDPASLGMSMTLTLNEDYTCDIVLPTTMGTGTWAVSEAGVILSDEATGDTLELTYADGVLSWVDEGVEMILTPGVPETEAADEAASIYVMPNLTAADFSGNWELIYMEDEYGYYMAEDYDIGMTVVIADGLAQITMSSSSGSEYYDAICTAEENSNIGGTVLWVDLLDPTTGEISGSYLPFLMFSNGELVWYTYDETYGETFYCFWQVTEEAVEETVEEVVEETVETAE